MPVGVGQTWVRGALIVAFALGLSVPALAEYRPPPDSVPDPAAFAIDEQKYLGVSLDPNVVLVDETGSTFRFADMLGKPLILLFSYYTCGGACPALNRAMAQAILAARRFHPGKDYRVLTLSFDSADTPESLAHFVHQVALPAQAGWRYALFKRPQDIPRFTASVGFKYFWSPGDKVFFHSAAYIFVSPEGRVVRYLYGPTIGPRDIELAVVEANWNELRPGRVSDILLGVCYSYNFKTGRYALNYPVFIAGASLLSGIALVLVSLGVYRKRHPRRTGHA